MYNVFKRPMFKRGGSTQGTGIMSHVERRPNYSIGGGVIQGNPMGSRIGFQNPIGTSYNINLGGGGGTPVSMKPNFTLQGSSYVPSSNLPAVINQAPPTTFQNLKNIRYGSLGAGITGVASGPAFLSYMNRPKTYGELKFMKDNPPLDETASQDDYIQYEKARKKAAESDPRPINFTDAFFLDPETGTYPKFMGRTEDRPRRINEKINIPGTDMRGDPAQFAGEDELTDFNALAKEEEAKEKAAIAKAKAAAEKDAKYTESDILSSVEDEKKILDKILPDNVSTSEKAFLIAKAMKGETLSDKLDIAGTEGMKLAKGKSARDREKALLAYKGATQKDLAKIAAGKKGFSEKQFEEMSKLKAISENTKLPEKVRNKALKDLASKQSVINMLSPKQTRFDPRQTAEQLNAYNKDIYRIINKPKSDPNYQKDLSDLKNSRELLLYVPEARNRLFELDKVLAEAGILEFKKDGGRIGYALGTENPMATRPAVGQVPTEETSKLSFEDLRNRLPKEITDGVVRLISSSDQALQDFSYIRTQGDVVKFNQKYGVNLVLPAEA